jgi:hypothetical protein
MPRRPPPNDQPWPRCRECDGPAKPVGTPSLRVRFEVVTRSEANERSRWGKIKRADAAREATIEALAIALGEGQEIPKQGPWFVRLTRISRGKLDTDNLGRALKRIQDTVAAAIGVDDGSPRIEFDRRQQSEGPFLGCVIEIWSASSGA